MKKGSIRKKYERIVKKQSKPNIIEPDLMTRLGSLIIKEVGCTRDQKQEKRLSVPSRGRTFIP
jgi:hypothetical protein